MDILNTIRASVTSSQTDRAFDVELLLHTRAAVEATVQLGVTELEDVYVDYGVEWPAMAIGLRSLVTQYITLKVKSIFDPSRS